MVCFHSGFFLQPVWCTRVLQWCLDGSGGTWQTVNLLKISIWFINDINYWFGIICNNRSTRKPQLMSFSSIKFLKPDEPATSWLPNTPHSPPIYIEALVVSTGPWNKLLTMAGNSASYAIYSRYNELYTSNDYRLVDNVCEQLFSFSRYNELNISKHF